VSFFDIATLAVFILVAPHLTSRGALRVCWLLIAIELGVLLLWGVPT
jgi:hypothetical protein